MKKKLLLILAIAALPVISFAQGAITIFSEDGDRFYLVLNGIKQNSVAQTNVRVDGLTNDYYSAKILFEDKAKGEISKNIPVKDAATNDFADMTYKIKKTNKGELKIRYFSATPVPPNYTAPPDMYYVHFGAPATTQTTQTTTVVSNEPTGVNMNVNGAGVNMSVNIADPTNGGNGVNMNLNINDGNVNGGVNSNVRQTTTTTTTYSNSTTSTGGGNYNEPAPTKAGCGYPMDMSSFSAAKKTIKETSFEDTKLSTAKSILGSNCLSTDQVVEICKLFGFEESKLAFAKAAYPKTTDKSNYFKVNNVFSFDASKTELNEFIGQ